MSDLEFIEFLLKLMGEIICDGNCITVNEFNTIKHEVEKRNLSFDKYFPV